MKRVVVAVTSAPSRGSSPRALRSPALLAARLPLLEGLVPGAPCRLRMRTRTTVGRSDRSGRVAFRAP